MVFGPEEDEAPDAAVGGAEPGHRAHHALVGALEPVAGRLVAQRHLEEHVALPQLDRVALVVEQPHQAGVRDRDVVALEVVVGDDLPVRRLAAGRLAEPLHGRDVVRGEPLLRARRGRRRSGAASRSRLTKTKPANCSTRAGIRPSVDLSSPAKPRPSGHADQAAVGAVGPAVVGAAQRLAALAAALAQARRAVAADVAERAQLAVLAADQQRRLGADLHGGETAGLAQVRRRGRRAATCVRRSLRCSRCGDLRIDVDLGGQRGGRGGARWWS